MCDLFCKLVVAKLTVASNFYFTKSIRWHKVCSKLRKLQSLITKNSLKFFSCMKTALRGKSCKKAGEIDLQNPFIWYLIDCLFQELQRRNSNKCAVAIIVMCTKLFFKLLEELSYQRINNSFFLLQKYMKVKGFWKQKYQGFSTSCLLHWRRK